MNISIGSREMKEFLASCDDCEQISSDEYVLDLYDETPPLTINLRVTDASAEVLAAATLAYSDTDDGWFMDERVDDAHVLESALSRAMGK